MRKHGIRLSLSPLEMSIIHLLTEMNSCPFLIVSTKILEGVPPSHKTISNTINL